MPARVAWRHNVMPMGRFPARLASLHPKGRAMNFTPISDSRHGELRAALPGIQQLLTHRRAGEIDEAMLEELVDLSWLEWNGGTLRLTPTGRNILLQMQPPRY